MTLGKLLDVSNPQFLLLADTGVQYLYHKATIKSKKENKDVGKSALWNAGKLQTKRSGRSLICLLPTNEPGSRVRRVLGVGKQASLRASLLHANSF